MQRLSSIVGQLSFLARADAGVLPSAREPVALDDLVRDLAEETMILASAAEISVTIGECQSVSVSGDKMRLRQLLLNLADNAVKYNERGGSIEMSLVRQNDDAVFTITNTGPALPSELRARVFERFFRGDLAHNSATEGTAGSASASPNPSSRRIRAAFATMSCQMVGRRWSSRCLSQDEKAVIIRLAAALPDTLVWSGRFTPTP